MPKSESYEKCRCGADCFYLSDSDICWGEVEPRGISGDDDFCHVCEGHDSVYYGEKYKHEEKQGMAMIGEEIILLSPGEFPFIGCLRIDGNGKYTKPATIRIDKALVIK